jgi:hypothetical protein
LEHLELATSLETYISYLTQLVIAQQGHDDKLAEKMEDHLNKLLGEDRFSSKKL